MNKVKIRSILLYLQIWSCIVSYRLYYISAVINYYLDTLTGRCFNFRKKNLLFYLFSSLSNRKIQFSPILLCQQFFYNTANFTIIYSQTKDEILNQQSEFDGYKLNFAQTALREFHFWFYSLVPFGKCVVFYFLFKWNVCFEVC